MACVLHGEFHTKEQQKVAFFLAPWVPPERNSLPAPSSTSRQQQARRGGGGGGAGGDAGRPASFREPRGGVGGSAAGGGGVPASQVSQRFTAPAQMLVSKVMAYVLSHEDLRQHLESTVVEEHPAEGENGPATASGDGGGGGGRRGGGAGRVPGPSREAPEDLVEVLCGDRVVEPHLYIGAIQQHIWNPKASGTLFLHYRS
ncbi:unnamed protein product, partial [Hapterophycus canaliculatus]